MTIGFSVLKSVVEEVSKNFELPAGPKTKHWISLLKSSSVVDVEVPVASVAEFWNELGKATVAKGLLDVQYCSAPGYGVTVDVDKAVEDIPTAWQTAGLQPPTAYYHTPKGFKLHYAASERIPDEILRSVGQALVLAFEGGDLASIRLTQMQRLAHCIRADIGEVNHRAVQANGVPFDVKLHRPPFPIRIAEKLGGVATASMRPSIRAFLASRGIIVPEPGAKSLLIDRCLDAEHDKDCCYVNCDKDGRISMHCLGGHDGAGEKHWSEAKLVAAMVGQGHDGCVFDVVKHLPTTPAMDDFVNYRLADESKETRQAVRELLISEQAEAESERYGGEIPVDEFRKVAEGRRRGRDGRPPLALFFSEGEGLCYRSATNIFVPLNARNGTNTRANRHELMSTRLWTIRRDAKGKLGEGWIDGVESDIDKLDVGVPAFLALYGVPRIRRYASPIAHVETTWAIDPKTFVVDGVITPPLVDVDICFDVLEWLLDEFRNGNLPLASENDVRCYAMMIAAPLLRGILPGQLGVYWFHGLPGSGKDFLIELAAEIWRRASLPSTNIAFELHLVGELETMRTFAAANNALYARAKEAGKKAGIANELIKLAATDTVVGRGMGKLERPHHNVFTFVADSAEELPDRREISRRTVRINVVPVAKGVSLGETRRRVLGRSKDIIASLKRLIEAKPRSWFDSLPTGDARPLGQTALSDLFGVTLQVVAGEDMSEIFDAMLTYTRNHRGEGEINRDKLAKAKKEHRFFFLFPVFKLTEFIHDASKQAAFAELVSPYHKKTTNLYTRLHNENDYAAAIKTKGYQPVEINGETYAFRMTNSKSFILVPEKIFLAALEKDATPPSDATPQPAIEAAEEIGDDEEKFDVDAWQDGDDDDEDDNQSPEPTAALMKFAREPR